MSPEIFRISSLLCYLTLILGLLFPLGCAKSGPSVVVYASQDQVYAEPLLKQFEATTGIKVRVVYDSEAVKTVGLANRLVSEKSNPQCDVFWNNEELRTRQLEARGVLGKDSGIIRVGYRSRRIVINTNRVTQAAAPVSFAALTNAEWSGKLALAYPLFGTTATHFMYLRELWGVDAWEKWCEALLRNKPKLVDGNSTVVNLVARGEAWVGCTDSDDITAGLKQRFPISQRPELAPDSLLIPNTLAMVGGARNGPEASALKKFLGSLETARFLVQVGALEGVEMPKLPSLAAAPSDNLAPVRTEFVFIHPSIPPWPEMLRNLDATTAYLKEHFLR